jgi:hypothetical protein
MSNFLDITSICYQRKQRQLYNNPLPRYTPISPYPNYTQFQLNMRRKAEILKYKSNLSSTQTNSLTKKELFSNVVKGKYRGNTLFCPNDLSLITLSSSCDVPGPITILYDDNTIPLYNFINNTAAYAVDNTTNPKNYYTTIFENVKLQTNTETPITSLFVQNNVNSLIHTFSIQIPIAFHIQGSNINQGGPYDLQLLISSISILIYYSQEEVLFFNGTPNYYYTNMNTPIQLSLMPPDDTNSFLFSAFVYAGILNISNINLYTQPGYIYDIRLNFNSNLTSSNTSNSSIINNTYVSMYANISNDLYQNIVTNGGRPFNNINPYNCVINNGNSTDSYVKASVSSDF